MGNKYNDEQILSPKMMEEVAKKYNEEINKKHSEKKTSEDFCKHLNQLKHTINVIKNFIYTRKVKDNRLYILNNIISNIDNIIITECFNTSDPKKVNSYYQAITLCTKCCIDMARTCLSGEYNSNAITLLNIMEDLIRLI